MVLDLEAHAVIGIEQQRQFEVGILEHVGFASLLSPRAFEFADLVVGRADDLVNLLLNPQIFLGDPGFVGKVVDGIPGHVHEADELRVIGREIIFIEEPVAQLHDAIAIDVQGIDDFQNGENLGFVGFAKRLLLRDRQGIVEVFPRLTGDREHFIVDELPDRGTPRNVFPPQRHVFVFALEVQNVLREINLDQLVGAVLDFKPVA